MELKSLCWSVVGSLFLVFAVGSEPGQQLGVGIREEHVSRSRRDTSSQSYFYCTEPTYPRDCQEVYDRCEDQAAPSGVFTIQPDGATEPFKVYCNNSIDGGGWTVFQRRMDGSVYFYRSWNEFRDGFGFFNREFWLGNDYLSYLTSQGDYELRIDMNNVNGVPYFAKYSSFRISDERSKYRMVDLGAYLPESTANYDALRFHRNMSFSTYDQDNDRHSSFHCAEHYRTAWWFNACHEYTYLNGNYFDCRGCWRSIKWQGLPESHYNLQYTEMKIRPRRSS